MATVNDDVGDRLIDAASRMLVEDGPAGLSLRKLATQAGVSTMAVYTRFGDKPKLLEALYAEGFARLGARLRAVPQTDDPLTDLGHLGLAYRGSALAGRYLYPVMFSEFRTESDAGRVAADAAHAPLVEGVRRCLDAGQLIGDEQTIALHLWGVTHGMVSLELSGRLPAGVDPEAAYGTALGLAVTPFLPG